VKEEQRNSDITLMWKLSMRRHQKLEKTKCFEKKFCGLNKSACGTSLLYICIALKYNKSSKFLV
jgi:hypothetical protein